MSTIYKAATAAANGNDLEFILSDATVDRYGDIVEPSGWVLNEFKADRNPIALFGHNSAFPIGRWENVRVEGGKLVARLKLAARGTSDRINELIGLVEQGILRAVSVGFRPIKSEPIDPEKPYGGQRYQKQELLEASLVSIGANPEALAVAKSLNVSHETIFLAFGEQADLRRRDVTATGGHASKSIGNQRLTPMKPLAQRIEDAQNDLVAKRDKLTELNAADELDLDAIEAATEHITVIERTIAALKASEAKVGLGTMAPGTPTAPAVARRPLGYPQHEVKGFDLLVRSMVARGISHFGNKSIDSVLDERYPGHEATHYIAKADQTIGTTTVAGWASELVQTVNQGFIDALLPYSFYPALRSRGISVSFDGIGTVSLPSRTAGGAGGGFVAEGTPIRVGRITTAAVSLVPKKLGVIVPFSRELARRSTPMIEGLVRQAILEDTAAILDAAIIDTGALSVIRPAGLLNGLGAAAVGFGGGDALAVIEDFRALLTPFYTANAADNITVLMNPAQGLSMSMMPGPGAAGTLGWTTSLTNRLNIVESTTVPANRLIALRNSDFVTMTGDMPEIDISEHATVHMEDVTPLEIVTTVPATADPVRSFFQTATIGVRMLMDVTWIMRRAGMVQWVDTTSW